MVDACPTVKRGSHGVIVYLFVTSFATVSFPPESLMSREQAAHDRINLYRLVRRLEKSVAEEGWPNPGDLNGSELDPHAAWIRTQGTLGVSLPPNLPSGSRCRPEYLILWRFPVFRR